jgi:hypothetical protein
MEKNIYNSWKRRSSFSWWHKHPPPLIQYNANAVDSETSDDDEEGRQVNLISTHSIKFNSRNSEEVPTCTCASWLWEGFCVHIYAISSIKNITLPKGWRSVLKLRRVGVRCVGVRRGRGARGGQGGRGRGNGNGVPLRRPPNSGRALEMY